MKYGKNLVFEGKAKTPDDNARIQAVIKTWGKVWKYFDADNPSYKRAFTTGFEYYKNQSVLIFIYQLSKISTSITHYKQNNPIRN